MPGFPTQVVGTPINRGKARRYKTEEKRTDLKVGHYKRREADGEVNSPLQ